MHSPRMIVSGSRPLAAPVLLLALLLFSAPSRARAEALIQSIRFHPEAPLRIDPKLPSMNKSWPGHNYPDFIALSDKVNVFVQPRLWADRYEYWTDDLTAQFFAILEMPQGGMEGHNVVVEVTSSGKPLASVREKATDNKVSFLVRMRELAPGKYLARATLSDAGGASVSQAEFAFEKTKKRNAPVTIPNDGIPIVLEAQTLIADGRWPVRTGVPLPLNTVFDANRLALYEDGGRIPAEIRPRATWSPDGSVQWVHLDFQGRYRKGKSSEYRLRLLSQPAKKLVTQLTCQETGDRITVDTGYLRFAVNRRNFAGIEEAWFDPDGGDHYEGARPMIRRAELGGPFLVNEANAQFDARLDDKARVVFEERGPLKVTIAATGWYANSKSADQRLCKTVTRIKAFTGQPMLRVTQDTYITFDSHSKQLADLAFHIPVVGAKSYQLGADGRSFAGELPAPPNTLFLRQDRWDHFRIVGGPADQEGKTADGWFSLVDPNGRRVSVFVRDIWQKYPKEVELSREGLTLHFWPKHGREVFTREEEMDVRHLYKFLCFHHGRLMNLKTPDYYVERFEQYSKENKENFSWRPSEKDGTRSGNAQGVVIHNEFALVFSDDRAKESPLGTDIPKLAATFQRDPAALAGPEWNASTGALGPMAAVDRRNFPEMEAAVENGYLSWTRSVERNKDYGMFNYADTHTSWNVAENRPGLHRTWQSSHYHNVGKNWLLYYRSGSPEMLRWARKNGDHHMNVDTINHVDPDKRIRFHDLGAMYHVGWKQHWGSSAEGEAWGQFTGVADHFIDPDAFLWNWYLTGNERAREAYGFWSATHHARMQRQFIGYAREFNTTFAYVLTRYGATWDPTLLPAIHTMAYSLRTKSPLENQRPGPLWHPLWINRYYEQTRDPQYVPLIVKYADMWTSDESTWTLALASLAYEITGERRFLEKHVPLIQDWPREFYREDGHAYDWFGKGPGPLGGNYGYMSWGTFLASLRHAGIKKLGVRDEEVPAEYPAALQQRETEGPQTHVVALDAQDKPFIVRYDAHSLWGDLHNWRSVITSPTGNTIHELKLPPPDAKIGIRGEHEEKVPIAVDGEKGLYRIGLSNAKGMIRAPATDLPHEAAVLKKNVAYFANRLLAYVRPTIDKATVTLTLTAPTMGAWVGSPCDFRIADASGKPLLRKCFFHYFEPNKSVTIALDPRKHPLPWKFDSVGPIMMRWEGEGDSMLIGRRRESVEIIARQMSGSGQAVR